MAAAVALGVSAGALAACVPKRLHAQAAARRTVLAHPSPARRPAGLPLRRSSGHLVQLSLQLRGTEHNRQQRRRAVVRSDLEPDNSSILVAGGGGVALQVTRLLSEKGAWVTALQRSGTRQKVIEGYGAIVAMGDALKPDTVKAAINGKDLDAVVSTVGGTPSNPAADSEGNINIIKAAKEAGVKRFVLVTSIGTGDSKDATPPNVYQTLEPVLVEKTKAEDFLKSSGLEWTIIRPGGLKSEPATGTAVLTESTKVVGSIHREDVASLVIRALFDTRSIGKTLSAIDPDQTFPGAPKYDTFEVAPF
eukprot:jgi/Chlat1/2700/Chrsp180S02873